MAQTKSDIITAVMEATGFPKKQASNYIEFMLKSIKDTLGSGEDVLISGFGKFSVRKKKARRGRNPATGDSLILEPRRVVTFKVSGELREKVNGKR